MTITIKRGLVHTSYGYIHYREAGAGEAIVLMHINQQSSELYREMMTALAPHFRVVAVDFPGHGCSDHIDFQPTLADYGNAVDAVMSALGLQRYTVLGEATGSGVAIELASTRKDKVVRCVLVNCPELDRPPEEELAQFRDELRPGDETGFPLIRTIDWWLTHDPLHAPMEPDQAYMDRINRAQIECGRDRWQALTALHYYPLKEGQTRIDCPVLMLVGEHFYCRDKVETIGARIKDFRWHELPGARFCAGWEKAEEIASRIVAFAADSKDRAGALIEPLR